MSFFLSRRRFISGTAGLALAGGVSHAATSGASGLHENGTAFNVHAFGVLAVPKTLPPLSIKDEQGRDVPLSHFFGQPFILHFWATWCPPCIAELPSVNTTAKALGSAGPQIIVVAVRGSTIEKVRAFYDKHGIDALPLYVDPRSEVMIETADDTAMRASLRQIDPQGSASIDNDTMSLHAIPRSLLLNAKGQVVAEAVGGLNWSPDSVRQTVRALA